MTAQEETTINELTAQQKDLIEKSHAFAKLMSYYKCVIMEVETKFNVLNEEFSINHDRQPINSIKTRLKNPASIRRKLLSSGLPLNTSSMENNLSDIAGIRVICSFVDDVYMLADTFLKQDDVELIARKDYIAHSKANGYRSLHLIIAVPIFLQQEKRIMRAEVQLRTVAMDSWASLEHQLRYKKDANFDEQMAGELKYCADISAVLDSKMGHLYAQIFGVKKEEKII